LLIESGKSASFSHAASLGDVDLGEAEAVEERGDGRARVLAGGVEDAIGKSRLLELLLGLGPSVGLEVLVGRDEEAGRAEIDAGLLVVECGDEELRGRQRDVDGLATDADVFGVKPGQVNAGDGLAVDNEEDAVADEQVRKNCAGFGAFDDGVDGVDDGFETVETLDLLHDCGDGGVEEGGAGDDAVGDVREDTRGGVPEEDDHGGGAQKECEKEGEDGSRRAAA